MRRKSVLRLLSTMHRNEAAALAARLVAQHGLHGSKWLLRDLAPSATTNEGQLDLIEPADLSWIDTCEVTAQLLVRSVEAASLPDLANASALLSTQLAPELRIAWLKAAKRVESIASRPIPESIEYLAELASQVAAARDAIAFHLADRAEAAAHWERVVTDWANFVIAQHRPLVWAIAERPADPQLIADLLPLTLATSDLAANPAPLQSLGALLPADHLSAAADSILQTAADPAWQPRWTAQLLAIADRAAQTAGRLHDFERLVIPMLPKNRDAIVYFVERLARGNDIDQAHYWLSEGQRLFPRDQIWDRLLESVGR